MVADVSAIIPYLLFQDEEIQEAVLKSDWIIAPKLYVPEIGNTLLKYLLDINYDVSCVSNLMIRPPT